MSQDKRKGHLKMLTARKEQIRQNLKVTPATTTVLDNNNPIEMLDTNIFYTCENEATFSEDIDTFEEDQESVCEVSKKRKDVAKLSSGLLMKRRRMLPAKMYGNSSLFDAATSDVVQQVTSDVVQQVTSDVVQQVTSDVVQQVTSDVVQQVTSDVVQQVTSDVVQQVTSDVVQQVTSDVVQQGTSDVVQQVTSDVVQQVTSDVVQQVTSDVVQQVTSDVQQVTSDVVQQVTSDVVQQVTSDVVQQVTSDVVQQVTSDVVQQVTSDVVQQVTSDVVQQVTSDVVQQITSDVVQQVTSDVVQQVTSDVVQQVTSDVVQQVTSNVVQQVTSNVVQQVTSDVVQQGTTDVVQQITSDVVQQGTSDVVQQGTSDVVQQGTSDVVQQGTSDVVQQGTSDVVQQGTSDVVQQGTSDVVQQGTSDVVQQGTSDVVQQGTSDVVQQGTSDMQGTSDVVQQVTSDVVQQVTSDVVQQVTSNVVQQVTSDVVQLVTADVVQQVTANMVQQVTADVVQQVTADVVQQVTSDMVQQVTSDVIQQITSDVVQQVTSDVVQQVTSDVVQQVTSDVVQQVTSDVIQQVTSDVIQQVAPDVIQQVTSDVIQQVTSDVIQQVTSDVVQQVTSDVVQQVTSDVVQQVTSDVIQQVTSDVVQQVTSDVIQQVTSDVTNQATSLEIMNKSAENDSLIMTMYSNLLQIAKDNCYNCGSEEMIPDFVTRGQELFVTVSCNKCNIVTNAATHKLGEINRQTCLNIYAELLNGGGYQSFVKYNDLRENLHLKTFRKFTRFITERAVAECRKMLQESRDSVFAEYEKNGIRPADNGVLDVNVSFNVTWQSRDFYTKMGLCVVTEADTGLVLDYQTLTKYCNRCSNLHTLYNDKKITTEHFLLQRAKHEPVCKIFDASSSSDMEARAAEAIWGRSLTYNMRYLNLISEGDVTPYTVLNNMNNGLGPYFGPKVNEVEWVDHYAKRLKSRLIKLIEENHVVRDINGKKAKLFPMKGKGKLSDDNVDKLVSYFSRAIKESIGTNIETMRNAILASYFHCTSSNTEPNHNLCPTSKSSWCFYNKAIANYVEVPSHSTMKVVVHLKPAHHEQVLRVYKDLTEDDMMQRCLGENLVLHNENFQGRVWTCSPNGENRNELDLEAAQVTALPNEAVADNEGTSSSSTKFSVQSRTVHQNQVQRAYENLSEEDTMHHHLDGRTKNPSENFHQRVWTYCPEGQYRNKRSLDLAVAQVTAEYTCGYHGGNLDTSPGFQRNAHTHLFLSTQNSNIKDWQRIMLVCDRCEMRYVDETRCAVMCSSCVKEEGIRFSHLDNKCRSCGLIYCLDGECACPGCSFIPYGEFVCYKCELVMDNLLLHECNLGKIFVVCAVF
nr:uncharacterized protein LOC128698309 [Cherax quadricarinatus]